MLEETCGTGCLDSNSITCLLNSAEPLTFDILHRAKYEEMLNLVSAATPASHVPPAATDVSSKSRANDLKHVATKGCLLSRLDFLSLGIEHVSVKLLNVLTFIFKVPP